MLSFSLLKSFSLEQLIEHFSTELSNLQSVLVLLEKILAEKNVAIQNTSPPTSA